MTLYEFRPDLAVRITPMTATHSVVAYAKYSHASGDWSDVHVPPLASDNEDGTIAVKAFPHTAIPAVLDWVLADLALLSLTARARDDLDDTEQQRLDQLLDHHAPTYH